MIKKFNNLSLYWKTSIITLLITLFLAILTIPIKINSYGEISFGILLGGLSGAFSFMLFAITNEKKNKSGMILTILLLIIMFLLHIIVLLISAFTYFKMNIFVFNIFGTFGSIFIATIIFALLNLFNKRNIV